MIRKIFGATLFVWLLLFAQIVSAESIEDISAQYYAKAKTRAFEFAELRTYSDHGTHHAALVAIKSQEAADAIERATFDNPFYSSIDRLELQIASIMHDTGMDGGAFKTYSDGNALRKDHSLNSAIHVLENRAAIAALGVNVDAVALDCMGHSKSCSGLPAASNGLIVLIALTPPLSFTIKNSLPRRFSSTNPLGRRAKLI